MFLLIVTGLALIGGYNALFPLSAGTVFTRFFALSSLYLICVSLIIGPLAVLDIRFAALIESRRSVGIAAFVLAAIHTLLAFDFYFGFSLNAIISSFPQIVVLPAAVILLAMTLTSSDWAVKNMGMGKWKYLQMLIYPAFVLILVHFFYLSNGLFSKMGSLVFVNLSEIGLLVLCAITILLQVAGFYVKHQRMSAAAKARQASATEEVLANGEKGKGTQPPIQPAEPKAEEE